MAGHSKWKQIKHKKAAADVKRAAQFGKMARAITAAVQLVHGDEHNSIVQVVLERARAIDMPRENIERAVQKGKGVLQNQDVALFFEMYGPGGVAIICSALTDSRNRTVQEIKHSISEYGVALGAEGSALWAFDKTTTGFAAKNPRELSEGDSIKLVEFIEMLENNPDIQEVWVDAIVPL